MVRIVFAALVQGNISATLDVGQQDLRGPQDSVANSVKRSVPRVGMLLRAVTSLQPACMLLQIRARLREHRQVQHLPVIMLIVRIEHVTTVPFYATALNVLRRDERKQTRIFNFRITLWIHIDFIRTRGNADANLRSGPGLLDRREGTGDGLEPVPFSGIGRNPGVFAAIPFGEPAEPRPRNPRPVMPQCIVFQRRYLAGVRSVSDAPIDHVDRRISGYLGLERLRMLHVQVECNMERVANHSAQSPAITATHKSVRANE